MATYATTCNRMQPSVGDNQIIFGNMPCDMPRDNDSCQPSQFWYVQYLFGMYSQLLPPLCNGVAKLEKYHTCRPNDGYHRALLPAAVRPCGDGNPPSTIRQDRHGRVLVVRQRRASVETPPLHEVPGLATADEEAVEGCRGGPGVGQAESPVGETLVEGEGNGRGFGILAHHEGGVRRHRKHSPRG